MKSAIKCGMIGAIILAGLHGFQTLMFAGAISFESNDSIRGFLLITHIADLCAWGLIVAFFAGLLKAVGNVESSNEQNQL